MANEGLYERQKLIGMLYRNELARGLLRLGYDIEKTHADGRFEIGGVSRTVVEAFSTRRAEIEAAMAERNLGDSADNPRLAERAALMTRAAKRDVDRNELKGVWEKQAADLGFDVRGLVAEAQREVAGSKTAEPAIQGPEAVAERGMSKDASPAAGRDAADSAGPETAVTDGSRPDRSPAPDRSPGPAAGAVAWAMAHLSEREAVFARADLLAATLAHAPGAVTVAEAEREVAALEKAGTLHAVSLPGAEDSLATERTVGEERETVALMRSGERQGRSPMRGWAVQGYLNKGPLTAGQKDAVKLILSARDRVVGVQGYAGTGKTTMLDRARVLAGKKGYRMLGLAPSASAVKTLAAEAGIESETLQRFLARNAGVAAKAGSRRRARSEMRAAFAKTILVVDEGSLASTVQARDLLRIANEIRIPRVVLVGDAKQLDAVDAGKPFAQLQAAGMQTATMDEIMRQRDPALKAAVEASLKGDIAKAFEKLGSNVAEVKPDNIAGAVAARWLKLSPEQRENTGVMAPSHALRQEINGHIRERLAREGRIHGPAMSAERLVSKGYTHAEKALAGNYAIGDVVAFHRPYKRIGVEKGDERRVAGIDHKAHTVLLEGKDGATAAWKPAEIGGRQGGTEVYRTEGIELRAGDRIRWTRNDAGLGLVNSRTAEVVSAANGRVSVQAGGRQEARTGERRSAAAPSRPCLGLDRARVPGPHRGQRDRRHGGAAPASHHAEVVLRRDQPGAGPGGTGHRRRGRAPGPAPGRRPASASRRSKASARCRARRPARVPRRRRQRPGRSRAGLSHRRRTASHWRRSAESLPGSTSGCDRIHREAAMRNCRGHRIRRRCPLTARSRKA